MSSVAKAKRPMSAGRAKKVAKNSLVHIILGILAVVWLFPIFWIIMTSFRAESGAYTKYFFPHGLTFSNYTRLFTETTLLNFPRELCMCYCVYSYPKIALAMRSSLLFFARSRAWE